MFRRHWRGACAASVNAASPAVTVPCDAGRSPVRARRLTELGLIDEYCIYLHPVVLGSGDPFFAGPRSPLRLKSSERMDDDVLLLTYVPA